MTTQELYDYARKHHVENAQIRICDGMAVSMYPGLSELSNSRYEVVIDVSACSIVEFDELHPWQKIIDK